MKFYSRKLIKPRDHNAHGTLFGGTLRAWIDFVSTAVRGDVIEIGLETVASANTSITLKCEVRNKVMKATIIAIDLIPAGTAWTGTPRASPGREGRGRPAWC